MKCFMIIHHYFLNCIYFCKQPLVAKKVERDINAGEAEAGPADDTKLFVYTGKDGLSAAKAAELLEQYGLNELPENVEPKWLVFLKLFIQPMPIMIWLAIGT